MQPLHDYFTLLTSPNYANCTVAIDLCHNMFMMGALLSKKPEDVLELGIGSGFVTISLIHGLRYNEGRLTCVDNWWDAGGENLDDVAENLKAAGVNVVAPMNERDFLLQCPDGSYDFLISDADHLNSGTWIDEHLRVVRSGGFLFFHDTNQVATFPNMALITKRVRELQLHHYHFTENSRPGERCNRGWLFVIKN